MKGILMPELLSPAGNFEKLKAAILYGADAVYCAGQMFGMRAAADNFSVEELYEAAAYVHARGKKIYLTVNTMPHVQEYPLLRKFLADIKGAGIDAMIVADLGVFTTIREIIPDMEIHISTQTSIVSPASAKAWAAMGAKRLVLARELTMEEIRAIREALPAEIELEAFIHGSMCVSYSGRCLLANAFNGRDGNRGTCSQPCRWNYSIIEEKRPEMLFPIEQQEGVGTFIMSSKDMCMIEHIPALMESGIASFKIEGRMKSAYYTAVATNAYRMAIDAYERDPKNYAFDPAWLDEVESVSHREYGTGFYFDDPMQNPQLVSTCGYLREKAYFSTATEYVAQEADALIAMGAELANEDGKLYRFIQRNKVSAGEDAELISPGKVGRRFAVRELYAPDGSRLDATPHPSMIYWCRVPFDVREGDIMRAASGKGLEVRAKDRLKGDC
ncbi:MAG: U32 family peptidase [Ruminococcaceae bacterium]|nr:U32 family peptidase [Oscillospiraceae bacterium]